MSAGAQKLSSEQSSFWINAARNSLKSRGFENQNYRAVNLLPRTLKCSRLSFIQTSSARDFETQVIFIFTQGLSIMLKATVNRFKMILYEEFTQTFKLTLLCFAESSWRQVALENDAN